MRYDFSVLPIPLSEWEKLPPLDRLLKIREAYNQALRFLKGKTWEREAERRCSPGTLTWEVLDASFYQEFPEEHPRIKWFKAQWGTLFGAFLKQVGT